MKRKIILIKHSPTRIQIRVNQTCSMEKCENTGVVMTWVVKEDLHVCLPSVKEEQDIFHAGVTFSLCLVNKRVILMD